ncbi:MAG: amidohydrolase family protein [Candidatus Sulfotelmatobacter sp.]|nr:amidohydrolase family protein [Candidatus Sulfotelmatobacter sp.]
MFKLRRLAPSIAFLAVSLFFTADVLALQTLRYSIVSNSRNAGTEVDNYSADGHIDSTFEFNDRGRGPKIEAHYVIAADGAPARTDVTGNDYLKAPVDEHFSVEAGVGRWKSISESGKGPTPSF